MNGKTIPAIAWFCLLAVQLAFGQGAGNPFEIVPRLPKEATETPVEQKESEPGNPFEILAPQAPEQQGGEVAAPEAPVRKQDTESRYHRFLFTLVIQLFLFLTILFTLFRSVASRVYRAFLNDNMLSQLHREQGSIVSVPYFLFYLFFFFNGGFLLFLLAWHFEIPLASRHWVSFLWLTGGLAALFAGKHLVLKVLEAVLPVRKELRLYSFTIIIFSITLGILLFPFNLLIAYGPANAVSGVIVLAAVVTGLVLAFRLVRGIFIAGRILAFHLFHFLLYICTVEIAPALIVAKTVMLAVAGS